MQDRGDTIIHMARQIMHEGVESSLDKAVAPTPLNLRILCLSACLAAAGSYVVTAHQAEQVRPITKYERTELNALVFYTARVQSGDEEQIRHDIAKAIGLDDLDDLSLRDFERARDLLRIRAQGKQS